MVTENGLSPSYRKYSKSIITAERTWHLVTFNPCSAKPHEQLYKLSSNDCLVTESLHLAFDLKLGNTKNHFKNNLSK